MIRDIGTVAWKEWKELFARQGRFRGGTVNLVLVLAVFGVLMPWQFGRAWVESPMMLVYWGWVPLLLLSNVVVDAFAGERERHTLETLLASRLPDRAILFGKMFAAVVYAVGVTVGCLILGLISVNVLTSGGELLVYPAPTLLGSLFTCLLGSILVAALGVLVSLRAASVRQAGQVMGFAVLLVAFLPFLAVRGLLNYWKGSGHTVTPADTAILGIVVVGLFVLIGAGLIAVTMLRFQRSRLLLD